MPPKNQHLEQEEQNRARLSTGNVQVMDRPVTYKTTGLTLSDASKERLMKKVQKRADDRQKAKEKLQTSTSIKARAYRGWQSFKATITNKEVKTAVKNVGKETKAIGDMVSKTLDSTSQVVKSAGQGTTAFGAGMQFVETGVDIYLAKQKVDKAQRDLETVETRDAKEHALEENIAKETNQHQGAKRELKIAKRRVTASDQRLDDLQGNLSDKEKEVEKLKGQLRALDENIGLGSSGPHVDFLKDEQGRLTDDLSSAKADVLKAQRDKVEAVTAKTQEVAKLEERLRSKIEFLDGAIQRAPEQGVGTDVLEQQREKLTKQLGSAKDAIAKTEQEQDLNIKAKQENVLDIEGQLRGVDENLQLAQGPGRISTDFLQEQRTLVAGRLKTAETQAEDLGHRVSAEKGLNQLLKDNQTECQTEVDGYQTNLTKMRTELADLQTKDRLKYVTSEKELNEYNDSVPLERAKLMKSLLDGANSAGGVVNLAVSGAGTMAVESAKLGGGMIGIVAGPVTFGVNTKDLVEDVKSSRKIWSMKGKAERALAAKDGIKQDDGELIAIAGRMHLKQGKNFLDKGLSATKNAFGAIGGLGTAAAGVAAVLGAVGVGAAAAAVLTPVGWALAGAAAAAALGYGAYKLARHINSQQIKAALQTTLLVTEKHDENTKISELQGLSKKESKALDKVATKAIKAMAKEGIIKEKGALTMGELQNYASKKLLSRDTGIASDALYHRFKKEVAAEFPGKEPTAAELDQYIKREGEKVPVDSAMGLMTKLGVGLKGSDAHVILNNSNEADNIKFMAKKMYSKASKPKEAKEEKLSVRERLFGKKTEKGQGHEPQVGEKQPGGNKLRDQYKRQSREVGHGGQTAHMGAN